MVLQRKDRSGMWGLALAGLDAACIFFAYALAVALTLPEGASLYGQITSHLDYFVLLVAAWCFQAIDQRLLVSRRGDALIPQLFAFTKAVFLAIVFSVFVLALLHKDTLNRPLILVYVGLALVFMIIFRTTVRLGIWGLRRRGYSYRRILMIGANERAARVAGIIREQGHHGFQIVGFMDDDEARRPYLEDHEIQYLGPVDDLPGYLASAVVDVVYISLPIRSNYETIQRIAHLCEGVGVSVRLVADLFPLQIATSGLRKVADVPLLTLSRSEDTRGYPFMRQIVDMTVALILLVLLAPVWSFIALAIKLQSSGSVLVWEENVAPSKRSIRLLKFRTMSDDGEITPVGAVLHRYDLDELPELINILRGDMSHADPWRGLRPVKAPAEIREV